MKHLLSLTLTLVLATAAFGQSWTEVGDAGDFFNTGSQKTSGVGALTTLTGATDAALGDYHDSYELTITSATWDITHLDGSGTLDDSRLWLFDSAGNFLMSNDDDPVAGSLEASLTDTASWAGGINGAPLDPTVGDTVTLVVSGFSETILDADGDVLSFTGGFTDLNGQNPDYDGFDSWEIDAGGPVPGTGTYELALNGVAFANTAIPEPTTGLFLAGLGAAFVARRRR